MKKIFAFILLLLFTAGFVGAQNIKLKANDYKLLLPEGEVHFNVDKSKMTIRFEDSVTQEQRVAFFKSQAEIFKPYQTDWELFAEQVVLAKLDSSISEESYLNAVTQIQQTPLVKYSAPVLTYNNKYMQALYDLLFVHLKKPEDIDTLKHFAKVFKLEIDQSGGQLIRCRVTKNSQANTFEIAKYLQSFNLFQFAEPDFIFYIQNTNANQWYINNNGNNYPSNQLFPPTIPGISDADLDVDDAWQISTGDPSIKVAVLDAFGNIAGLNHPDNPIYQYFDATGNNFSGTAGNKKEAHGIACSGIISAKGGTIMDLKGIAYSSNVAAIKIGNYATDTSTTYLSNSNYVVSGINWSWHNCAIISNSNAFNSSWSSAINLSIDSAVKYGRANKGTLFFSGSGNENKMTIAYPSSYTNTISVGASNMCDERKRSSANSSEVNSGTLTDLNGVSCDSELYWGSNYGIGIDISAPGVKILTTDIVGTLGYDQSPSVLGGDYANEFNGTSAACPMAAGVMALILSANSSLTGQDARTVLEVTCDKVGGYSYNNNFGLQPNGTWSNDLGYGRVNAGKAVYSALVTSSCPDFDFSLNPTTTWLTDTKTITDNLWNIYRIPVTVNNTYSFKTGCGNGATANFQTSLVLLDFSCDTITNATSVCSNPTYTELIDWTATYTGYVYLKVRATNWVNGTYTLAYKYTAPSQTCTVVFSPTASTVSYASGSTSVAINAVGNWSISESCPWVTGVSPSSGSGNANVTVTYLANGALSSRSCTLTATCGSNTSNFTLNQNAPSLTLSSPSNGSSGLSCSGINFSWSSNISNVEYRLQISTSNVWSASGGFSTTVYSQNLGSSTSFTWTGAQANTTYYWCVRAYDVTNQVYTDFTNYRNFSTGSCGSTPCYATITLQDPPDNYFHGGCIGNDLTFTWTPQSSCTIVEYEIQFSLGSSFTNITSYYTTDPFKVIFQTTNATNTSSLYWRVRARTSSGWGAFSSYREFFIIACNGSSCNDPYEPNDAASLASAYNIMPVNFVNSVFHFKSSGACTDDSESDWDDYYRIDLPTGYYYSVESRLHDTYSSTDGVGYTGDMEYRYNDGNGWSATFEDTQHPAFGVMNGGTIRFHVEPWNNSAGFDGTYSLEVTVYQYQNNLKPYKPVSWDEPLVTSLTTGTNSNSSNFTTADAIYVDIAHINSSLATSGAFNSKLYIDGVTTYNYSSNGLQANSWETVQDISTGPLSAGWHEFKLFVDPGNDITESNENDNEYVKSIYVSPVYPDLLPYTPNGWSNPLVISTTTGTNTDAGSISTMDNIYIDAAYANISNIDASSSITRIFLDNTLVFTNAPLSLGANVYGFNQDINLGQLQAGTHELRMIVDAAGQVTESNENNNIYTRNFTVICNTPAQPSVITGNATTCQSVSQTYTVTNVPGITYTWAVTGGAITSGQGTNSVTILFTSGGTQNITVTPSNNCASGTARSRTVTVTSLPSQPSVISGSTTVCIGSGTQTYSVTNVPGITYSWSVTGGTFTSTGNSIIVTWNTAGNQSVIVTPSNSCGSGISRSLSVTVNQIPIQPTVILGNDSVCKYTIEAYSVLNQPSVNFTWSVTSGGALNPNSGSLVNITWATPGTQTVTVNASNSCGTPPAQTMTVVVSPTPNQPITPIQSTICLGTSVTLTAHAGISYVWSNNLGTDSTITVSPTEMTFYNVQITNEYGCTASASRTVHVTDSNFAHINPANTTTCNNPVTLTASGGTSYSWSNSMGINQSITVNPLSSTIYNVTATDANGCTSSATSNVTVNCGLTEPCQALGMCIATTVVIAANTAGNVAESGPNYGCLVSVSNPTWRYIKIQNSGAINISITNSANVDVDAAIWGPFSDLATACTSSNLITNPPVSCNSSVASSFTLSIANAIANQYYLVLLANFSQSPTNISIVQSGGSGSTSCNLCNLTTSILGNSTICQGNSTTLTATGGASYLWSNGLGTGASKTVSPASSTLYTVTTTDNNGCTASASKTVNVNSLPVASISPSSTSICSGASTTLTANGGVSYIWSNSLGTNNNVSVSPLANTTYTVTVTGSNTCTATANSIVSLLPIVTPDITIQPNKTTACAVDTVLFTANIVNGGTTPMYQWQKNGVNVGSNSVSYTAINPTGTDVFRCILTSNATCASPVKDTSNIITITVVPSVTPTISIAADNHNNCNNQLTNFTATTTNAGNSPVFVWKSNGTIVGTNSNTYDNVFLTGGEVITCQLTSSICASPNPVTSNAITVAASNSPAVIGFPQGPSTACVGDISTYTASPGGSTSISWSVNNGTIISGQGTTSISILWQQAGSTTVTVVGTNICGSAIVNQEKMVTVGAPSDIAITANNSTVCDNTSPVFTATVTSPGTNSVYQWKLNGANVGSNTNTYTLSNPTTGNTVSCIYTSTNACSSSPNDTSNVITVTTLQSPANPAVTMIPSVWCDGNPTYLQASSCIGCTYQWNQSKLIPMIGLIVVPLNGNGNMVSVGEIQPGFTVNVTVTDANGCSSSTSGSFQATQLPNSASIITATTCQNNPYNFNGTNIASSGSFTDTLQSANGCDSVITLNLTVLPAYTTIIEESICAGTSYYFKGQNIVAPGVYLDTLQSSSSCDSIIRLILTVNNPSASSINASICQGSSYFFNNQNLTIAGTYTDTILNSLSCDSIITLNLSVDVPPVKPIITVIGDTAFCLGDSAILQTTNTAGTLLWNTNETTSSITVATSNIYNVQVSNQCGNAMSDNQQIYVFSLPTQPAIIQNADTLTSNVLANFYQWYYNQSVINGATTQSIVASQNGNYAVQITDTNGCKNTSVAYNYSSVGLYSLSIPFSVQIIPNPNTGQFTIQFSDNTPHNISITDVLGRLFTKETVTGGKQITNQNWADGIYFLNVISPNQTALLKFIIAK